MGLEYGDRIVIAKLYACAVIALTVTGCSPEPVATDCDRNCLLDIADRYLAAIAAHDTAAAPLAANAEFVENITRLNFGEGIWGSAAGPAGEFRILVPDPVAGTVGMIVIMDALSADGIQPTQVAIRLQIVDGEIAEAEHIVAALPEAADLSALRSPRAHLVAIVPEAERMPRDRLAEIAASYYEALDRSDGALAPFADDCERQENGLITAGAKLGPAPFDSVDVNGRSPPPVARDCRGQMSSRRFAYIDSIDDRRVFAVDPVQGLVMGLSHFRQSMTRGPQRMIAADGSELMWEEKRDPYDLPAAHVFKISDGEIHEVEAVGIFVPYGSPTAWE